MWRLIYTSDDRFVQAWRRFCELRREYGQCIGVSICGELDSDDQFLFGLLFPHFEGSGISTYADIAIERKIEKEQVLGNVRGF